LVRILDLFVWRLVISHCILFMTLFYFIIMFLVCSSCIFDIVIVDDEFMHMFLEHQIQFSRELGGTYYVSVVLRYYLPANAPYMPGRVVDHGCDRPVESYGVHPPCVGLVEPVLKEGTTIFLILPN
jgi:hypothetical protein